MPTVAEVLSQGWQVHQSGNVDAAMQLYRGVLHQVPTSADAWVYLGIAQFDTRDFAGSVQSYRRALAIRDQFPIAWNNLGNSLRMLGEIEQAELAFEKALAQQPGYLSALKNRGTLWVWNGEIERGLQWYQEGLKIDPDNAELHRNLGVIYLLLGDYARGFDEFRWRWKMPGVARPSISKQWQASGHHVPVWTGQPLQGKTIVIYPEQGLGDAIHFIRVAAELEASGARVFAVCNPRLVALFSSAPGIYQLIPEAAPGSGVSGSLDFGMTVVPDYQGSFLEVLDGLYQRDAAIYHGSSLFQADGRGYLSVPESSIDYWQRWLQSQRTPPDELGERPLIGINWQGNREHHADVYRSVPLEVLRPVVDADRFDVFSLQFGHGVEQLDVCDFAGSIRRLPNTLDQASGQFIDTASVLCGLDALVTTDTAIAHLAGSLGVKTHLLLGRVPDWRWLTEGDTTPWYPNTTISRQTDFGDWETPVQRIVDRLKTLRSD